MREDQIIREIIKNSGTPDVEKLGYSDMARFIILMTNYSYIATKHIVDLPNLTHRVNNPKVLDNFDTGIETPSLRKILTDREISDERTTVKKFMKSYAIRDDDGEIIGKNPSILDNPDVIVLRIVESRNDFGEWLFIDIAIKDKKMKKTGRYVTVSFYGMGYHNNREEYTYLNRLNFYKDYIDIKDVPKDPMTKDDAYGIIVRHQLETFKSLIRDNLRKPSESQEEKRAIYHGVQDWLGDYNDEAVHTVLEDHFDN